MRKTHTRQAFICILIPLLQLCVCAVFGWLATITEFPTGRSGIYVVFSVISIILIMSLPLEQLVCGIWSVVHQIDALRNKESKVKNYAMMAVSAVYVISAVWVMYQLWIRMMSV